MNYTIFMDESGTTPPDRTYAIGCLAVPDDRIDWFVGSCDALARRHRVSGELHWTDLRASYSPANFGLELFELVLLERLPYSTIIVEKDKYRNWNEGRREEAFYKTVSQVLKDLVARRLGAGEHRVLIDDRQDFYPKQTEVVEIIGNRMLRQLASAGKIKGVGRIDSREHRGIQAVDFITGAIRTARELYLTNGARACSAAKKLVMARMAAFIGWDGLHRDTMPRIKAHRHFNVWHFPGVCRGQPGSMQIKLRSGIDLITHTDLTLVRDPQGRVGGTRPVHSIQRGGTRP